jgi:hypothetical protein
MSFSHIIESSKHATPTMSSVNEVAPVVSILSPVVVIPENNAQSSSIISSIPRSIGIPLAIVSLIGLAGYVSYKYCPWWNRSLARKRQMPKEDGEVIVLETNKHV